MPLSESATARLASSQVVKIIILLSLVILFIASFSFTNAQQEGVSIKPAKFERTLDPGVEYSDSIIVENLSQTEQIFYVFLRDISGVGPGGVPVFATDGINKTGFELSDWITLHETEVVVPAKGKKQVSFTVNVPDTVSPGGHFGGIFISVKPPEIDSSGAVVGYQVASIVNIRISGDATEEADIREFSTSKFLYGSQNVDFSVRIENSGNVLVRPVGPVEIYSMLGKQVDSFVFNEDQKAVVPAITEVGRYRQENVEEFNFSWEGDGIGFGRYEAIISPVYGDTGAKKTMSSTVTFWVLPMNIIGPALGVLAVILLVTFIFVRLYIKRSLAHVHHGRRMISRRKKKGSSATLLIIVVTLGVTALFLIVLLALFA